MKICFLKFLIIAIFFLLNCNPKRNNYKIVPAKYDYISTPKEGRIKFILENKVGFFNSEGNIIIPAIYDSADDFNDGLTPVKKNNKFGFIDYNGKIVIPLIYPEAYSFKYNYAIVKQNNKYGVINKDNQLIIDFKFDKLKAFDTRPIILGCISSKCYLLDYKNKILNRFKESLCENNCYLLNDSIHSLRKRYFILSNNKIIYSSDYFGIRIIKKNYFLVKKTKNGKLALINDNGKFISEFIFDYVSDSEDDLFFLVKINNLYGYIDQEGKFKIPPIYKNAFSFSEGLAAVKIRGLYGYINHQNKIVIKPQYENAGYFKSDIAIVQKKSKKCIINKQNEIILPCKYENLEMINNNIRSSVNINLKTNNILNVKGEHLIESILIYRILNEFGYLIFGFNRGQNSLGIIDENGKIIIEPIYKWVYPLSKNLFAFTKKDKYGLLDKKGKILIKEKYDFIYKIRKKISSYYIRSFSKYKIGINY